jgi:hypothetical protein
VPIVSTKWLLFIVGTVWNTSGTVLFGQIVKNFNIKAGGAYNCRFAVKVVYAIGVTTARW